MRKGVWIFILVAFLAAFSFGQAEQQGQQNGGKASQVPPEQASGQAPKILGYDVAPHPSGGDEAVRAARGDIANYPTNADLGYKGILIANFDGSDPEDELLVDFGTAGVWYYNGGTWRQDSGVNPEKMITVTAQVTTDDEAIFDFGSLGLWWWNEGAWLQLSGVDPTGMFAVDDDQDGKDEIQVDFGSLGVWRCDFDGYGWTQYSGLNPYYGLRTDWGTSGYEEGTWNFPSAGMWSIYSNLSGGAFYTVLTGTVTGEDDFASAHFINSAGAEDLIADFSSLGTWLCKATDRSWVQVSPMAADRMKEVKFVGDAEDELLFEDLGGTGLYWGKWNGSGMTWHLITTAAIGPGWCETFDQTGADSGDEEVIIPINAGGCYLFDYSAGSTLNTGFVVSSYHANFIVKGDLYAKGYDSTLAVAFNTSSSIPGLWVYEVSAGWSQLSGFVPDGTY